MWIQYQDGREMRLISSKPHEDPEKNITGIQNATFSTDKTKVYFMSDAWVTSSSIHVVDIKTKKEQYVCPGNSLKVLQSGSHKGKLIVNQHRYKKGGGSYDHYFLVDEQGTELKDLGEDLDEELMEQIEK
ncbi:MAG: putative N-acetylmuramoyl-L-alanine amidase [Eubacterium sp.]|nr:putative N-acetylmuramoyl-L-alanine amidase [Eubacterium sp.]